MSCLWFLNICIMRVAMRSNKVRSMMYGFGDEPKPRLDSIKLMEEMVLEYISGLVAKVSLLLS
jgi:Transcription initiation factor IID, 18kD subunit